MRKNLRKIVTISMFVGVVALSSSCNRGYGCPNNFSMNDTVTTVVTWVINYLN